MVDKKKFFFDVVKNQVKAKVIELIQEKTMGLESLEAIDLLEGIIQNIKDLI